MEVFSSENYLAENPQLEEPVQSLYADEQPKRRLKRRGTYSKLAETVGIENTIMLNAEDLAKASGRSISNRSLDDTSRDQNDSLAQVKQPRTYFSGRQREAGTRRYGYRRRSPVNDINLGSVTAEARTSVIRGLPANRRRKPTKSESETEEQNVNLKDNIEKSDYNYKNLHCYEHIEKDSGNVGESLSGRGNYIQNTSDGPLEVLRNGAIQPDNSTAPDRISENVNRGPISGVRGVPYPVPVGDGRPYPQGANAMYLQQHVHELNTSYRMQHPPDFPTSQAEQRGKQFYDRSGLLSVPSSGPGMVPVGPHGYGVNPHGKFNIPDSLYVQTHPDLSNTYGQGGYSVYETRSPASSTSSGKDRESLPEQEGMKSHVQHFPSPVGSIKEEHGRGSPRLGKLPDDLEAKQPDGNKLVKMKRNSSGKSENANQCGQCSKTFASSSALAKHKLTHSDERRYICNICGKGFKRQDHLNGHMMTHRDKKPYECKYSDCNKSYCDMRSLRRHYENYHPSPDSMQPMVNSTGSCNSGSDKVLHKASSSRHGEDSHASDVEESQDSPQSMQEVSHHAKSKQEVPQAGVGRKRNSDSMCSNNSEDFSRRPDSHSPHQTHVIYDKPTSAVNMLKQVVEHSQEIKGEKQVIEGYPHAGYYGFPESFNPQWYRYQPPMIQMYQINSQVPIMVSHSMGPYGQMHKGAFCAGDPPQMVPSYPSVSQGQASRSSEKNSDDNNWSNTRKNEEDAPRGRMVQDSGAPTDPTSIAIVNAKNFPKQSRHKEANPGFSPVVQWKSVPVKDSPGMSPFSMGNNPVSMQHNPVNIGTPLPDHIKVKQESSSALNISIPSNYQGDKRGHEMMDMDHPHLVKRHCPSQGLPVSSGEERLLKIGDGSMKPPASVESNQEDVFRNPPATPPRKSRPKPEPINIPASNYSCSPMSPPIYTPPPMLSPRSIFHINTSSLTPRCGGTTPLTPSRFFLGNRSRRNSLDGDADQPEIIIPEPKINIGPQFQAEIPSGIAPRKEAEFDKHRVSMCWIPFEHETKKRSQEIEAFLDMACSVAVHGGGSNKEYALHVLCRLKGNIKQAVRHILANKSAIQKEDGLADYHYEGSEKWSAKERLKFREALGLKGKDFFQISKEVETKTVAQCVEFYYLWKATHPEAMRSRTRYAETESESEHIEDFSDDGISTLVFECDFPECNSKFISRQALNGHIRVHGGSFMKPSEPKRTKAKTTTNSETSSSSNTIVSTNASRPVTKPAKPPTSNASSVVPNGDGTLPEFACKVCGRIFHKIKSRSAHMKTHVKRSDDSGGSKG